ncbi:MAG: DUF3656 domain-containing protein [Actinomycetia bacterium]|nr:DUF3656 domain-containing protein [Actinomycetes bacterium]
MDDTHSHPTPHVELLAPAGSHEAFLAAVNNGADAVYLGLRELNARRGAENFTVDELADACRFAHLRGVRVYLTANILVMPEEMHGALEAIDRAWAAGVDAVIVQDLGLLHALRGALLDVRVHASTQMNTHDPVTAAVLEDLGVSRITLARETPVSEIRTIARSTHAEIESFVHGALCFCYSGQCLLSSAIGGRSANRGLCAQPCRLAYELRGEQGPVPVPGRYLLSARDLAGIEHLPELIEAGVAAFKIEGRMKAPEYVAIVTRVYRTALDRALRDPAGFQVSATERGLLEEAFSRGFTDAYLRGTAGNEMMSFSRPNNRGVPVGRVVAALPSAVDIAWERPVDAEDTVQFWTNRGHVTRRVGLLEVDGAPRTNVPGGVVARISAQPGVAKGDRVFRVANAAMLDGARRTFTGAGAIDVRPTSIHMDVRLHLGQPLRIRAAADEVEATVEGPMVAEARTKPLSVDEVMEHVGRMGGSGYVVESWNVDIEHGAGLGYSALHQARREVLRALDERRLARWSERTTRNPEVPTLLRSSKRPSEVALVVSVPDLRRAQIARAAGADRVLLRVSAGDELVDLPSGVFPQLPRVAYSGDATRLLEWARRSGSATVATLGELRLSVREDALTEADWPLNVANPWSAVALSRLGASFVWASPELSGRRLAALVEGSPVPVGTLVAGRLELMIAEHCILQAAGDCSHQCAKCTRRTRRWTLKDAKGYEFPVLTDPSGRAHLYNAVPLDLVRSLDQVLDTGVSAVRVEITVESAEETHRIVSGVASALARVHAGGLPPAGPVIQPSTTGHFFRSVR